MAFQRALTHSRIVLRGSFTRLVELRATADPSRYKVYESRATPAEGVYLRDLRRHHSHRKQAAQHSDPTTGPLHSAEGRRTQTSSADPPLTVGRLQRFEHIGGSHKVDTPIRYPLKLDMRKYMSTSLTQTTLDHAKARYVVLIKPKRNCAYL